ncbi:MAG: hypothetical protein ACLQMT_11880 [Candidatus Acidiferrales bacterium]
MARELSARATAPAEGGSERDGQVDSDQGNQELEKRARSGHAVLIRAPAIETDEAVYDD